jgi:hypothetical protein
MCCICSAMHAVVVVVAMHATGWAPGCVHSRPWDDPCTGWSGMGGMGSLEAPLPHSTSCHSSGQEVEEQQAQAGEAAAGEAQAGEAG